MYLSIAIWCLSTAGNFRGPPTDRKHKKHSEFSCAAAQKSTPLNPIYSTASKRHRVAAMPFLGA